ncbi:MAG: hypothetical protein GY811_29745 [Myxococcales bacterium]|nr:hypothetical protein [Myxococcales bacterium]
MRNLALFTIAPLLGGTGMVNAQTDAPEIKIGVAVSTVINAKPHWGPRVSAALGKALGETLSAQVLSGPDAQARLPEEARSETCLGDAACLLSAGKALGVDQLLMLIIVGVGDELEIKATWVDVATGDTALRPGITTADTADAMRAAFAAKAQELLPDVSVRASASTTASTTAPGAGTGVGSGTGSNPHNVGATKCSDGPRSCESGYEDPIALDIVTGGLATVALSAGLYMYFSGDEKEQTAAPVGLSVGSDSFQVSYGGSF